MITTTLWHIIENSCLVEERLKRLRRKLGEKWMIDEPLPFSRIVEINGLDDAVLCFAAERQYAKEMQLFSVWCAWRVQHFMSDPRAIAALNVTKRYANGEVTETELEQAMDAAWAAERGGAARSWKVVPATDRAARRSSVRAAASRTTISTMAWVPSSEGTQAKARMTSSPELASGLRLLGMRAGRLGAE